MSIFIKICGITNLEDTKVSLTQGADAIGFIQSKKSERFVGGTLTGFFGMLTIIIIPNFVVNYNLMITLEVFIFSIWFSILFYRHQLLKNNE